MTDGQSNKNKHLTVQTARQLKNMGVEIFVVAVGGFSSGIEEIARVASNPPEKHVYRIYKNEDLKWVMKLVLEKVTGGKYKAVKTPTLCR